MPPLVGAPDVDLEEGAGQLLLFPGRGRLAGAQPDDHVLRLRRLSGAKGKIADDPVALVEQTQNGDALAHGRNALIDGLHLGGLGLLLILLRFFIAAARGRRQHA